LAEDKKDIKKNLDSLKSDVVKVVGDIGELVEGVVGLGKEEVRQVRTKVEKEAKRVAGDAVSHIHDAAEKGVGSASKLKKRFSANPIASVLAVFGVGFLIGSILRKDD
jgi:ElaB/YqjD/DUF883 family membrane-anchored ribosome-binding protein